MESNVAFGAEGYRFVKMFPGASGKEISISGIVDGITSTGMRKCSFTDGKNHTFSLSHMKRHCKTRTTIHVKATVMTAMTVYVQGQKQT
jgi:hypothetical protein